MKELSVLATIIFFLQLVFSLYQLKYYNRFLKDLTKKYSDSSGYNLDTEISKNIFSSVVLAVVSNEENKIIEAYLYNGMTIFSKFKKINDIKDCSLDKDLLERVDIKKSSLRYKVLDKLIKRKM